MTARPVVALLSLLIAAPVSAQDTFEIQVYEYQTVPKGRWNLETHFNYSGKGSKLFEGTVAPSQGQTHLTFELTRGITDNFELAGYLILARQKGDGPEYAGYRIRPRVRAPESWKLPVGLSFSAEVGFPADAFEEANATLELRPIIEKSFGKVTLNANPVVGRALGSGGSAWDFEPGARIGISANDKLDLSFEYYGSLGELNGFLPSDEQVHLFFPGFDYQFTDDVVLNFGYGLAKNDAGIGNVLKLRVGWMFGGKK